VPSFISASPSVLSGPCLCVQSAERSTSTRFHPIYSHHPRSKQSRVTYYLKSRVYAIIRIRRCEIVQVTMRRARGCEIGRCVFTASPSEHAHQGGCWQSMTFARGAAPSCAAYAACASSNPGTAGLAANGGRAKRAMQSSSRARCCRGWRGRGCGQGSSPSLLPRTWRCMQANTTHVHKHARMVHYNTTDLVHRHPPRLASSTHPTSQRRTSSARRAPPRRRSAPSGAARPRARPPSRRRGARPGARRSTRAAPASGTSAPARTAAASRSRSRSRARSAPQAGRASRSG
jgi:hypothetical protein